MDGRRFDKLKKSVARDLSPEQCIALESLVKQVASRHLCDITVARKVKAIDETRCCPRCKNTDVVKHGFDKAGRQRFRCRSMGCSKTFNALTQTPFSRMRMPEKWVAYANLMRGFMSLDEIVKTGIGITRHTAWRWRHRFLQVQSGLQSDEVKGVIEADETFFRTSFKGHRGWKRKAPPENRPPRYRGGPALTAGLSGEQVPVLTALDQSGGVVEAILKDRSSIVLALKNRVARGSVLCSDGLKAYAEVAVVHGSEHRRIDVPKHTKASKAQGQKPRQKGRLTLGHVNAHHERLKTFVNRQFRGVSTRYLANYLGWMRAMRRPGFKPPVFLEQALAA
jgi:transposase-like protein